MGESETHRNVYAEKLLSDAEFMRQFVEDERREALYRSRSGRLNARGIREYTAAAVDRTLSADTRKDAARQLAADGAIGCVPGILAALRSGSRPIWSGVLTELGYSAHQDRLNRGTATLLWPAILPLLRRKPYLSDNAAARVLLQLDRRRGLEALLQARVFHVSNPALHHLLEAINQFDVAVPAPRLLALARQLAPLATKYPQTYQYAETLLALGRQGTAEAMPLINAAVESEDDVVAEYAARAMACLAGARDPRSHVFGLLDRNGFEQLTLPQRTFLCTVLLWTECENGGLSQFIYNTPSKWIRATPAACRRVGAPCRAEKVSRAISLFGPRGMPNATARRRDFMRSAGDIDPWNAIHVRGCEREYLMALAYRYAARHAAEFC